MGQSRVGLFFLALVTLFATLTGVSALFQRGPAPEAVADAVPALAGLPRVEGAEAPVTLPDATVEAAERTGTTFPSAAEPADPDLLPPMADQPTGNPQAPSTADQRAGSPPSPSPTPSGVTVQPADNSLDRGVPRPAPLQHVRPPADPKPAVYRPHPGLWERPVNNPARAERPTPLRAWLTPAERELLAHLIYAEAAGEPYEGKVAVAAVILNRLAHPQFPNTVEGVVFERGAFQPVGDGRLWRGVSERSYRALDDALRGWDPSGGALYFYNPRLVSPHNWIRSRRVIRVIGQHYFAI